MPKFHADDLRSTRLTDPGLSVTICVLCLTDSVTIALVWYAAYGSNMNRARFLCYVRGGVPAGGDQATPGCRDTTPPRLDRPTELPGQVYFATESKVWPGGGRAFLDPTLPGRTPARAYLITAEQFLDIVDQEMYGVPGKPLDLADVVAAGRLEHGPGRYETLIHAGDLDGHPVITFTAPWTAARVPPNPPAPAYLVAISRGLREVLGWSTDEIVAYLSGLESVACRWSTAELTDLAG